jgi:L-aminopeptidase/D-esterase-like protein
VSSAAAGVVPGRRNAITDVAGIRVGHYQRRGGGWLTGTTVVLPPPATVASVDVRGGGPGTRETDLLDPSNLVQHVHAVCLSGGSAFGLAAADGAMAWLAQRHVGFVVGEQPHHVVPIVPAAVLFDLQRGGRFECRPDASFGARAAAAARAGAVRQGCVGAGTGAVAGGMKGGIGTASAVLPDGICVAALVALNAAGRVHDPATGLLSGASSGLGREFANLRRPSRTEVTAAETILQPPVPLNTTIGVVATDAALAKSECRRLAMSAHDGLARAVRPAHGLTDGDTFFALATGARELVPVTTGVTGEVPYRHPESRPARLNEILAAVADVVTRAIVHAVLAATSVGSYLSYQDVFPSAVGAAGARR